MARYALVVGISEYKHLPSPLSKTLGDAEAVANLLRSHGDFQEVTLLNTPKLIKADLFAQLNRLLIEQATGGEVLIYYTGHGVLVEDCGVKQGYLAPSDTAFNKTDKDYLLISACRDFEQAAAMKKEAHSIFTGALLEALSASRQNDEGKINSGSLFGFISDRLKQKQQEPRQLGYGRAMEIVNYRQIVSPKVIDETCPYVGLNAFDESMAQWFFGRETAFKRLMSKIEQSPFVFVVGVSGSGKSSLVRAKLIPEMKRRGHRILVMKPWSNPIQKLKNVFAELLEETGTDVSEFEQCIDNEGLLAAIADLPKPILLVIDQFEEVFTVCSQVAERRRFIQMLVDVAQTQSKDFGVDFGVDLVVVATMRIDFLADCTYANLDAIVNEQMVVISGMSEDELRDAIAKPAETQGYQLSDGLLDAILQDIEAKPNCLPLLEFALQELWENRNRQQHRLTLEGYRQMERLKGALNRHAERLYEKQSQQSASDQEWMRRIFLKLVRTGNDAKDTRQRERRQVILDLAGDDGNGRKEIERILKSLEGKGGRLLVASEENGVAIVDLAHEALMDGWKRFAAWRLEDRDLRRLADRVRDSHEEWLINSKIQDYLLPRSLIIQVTDNENKLIKYLSVDQYEFYKTSNYHELHNQSALTWVEAKPKLEEKAGKLINSTSISSLDRLVVAINLIKDNLQERPHEVISIVQSSLLKAIQNLTSEMDRSKEPLLIAKSDKDHARTVRSVVFVPDSQIIVSGSADSDLRLWDLNLKSRPLRGHENEVWSVAFSPDGKTIISASEDTYLRLWSVKGNAIGEPFCGHSSAVRCVAFSPDGETIASGSRDQTLLLWNLRGELIREPFKHRGAVTSLAFSPDGQNIISCSTENSIYFWDLQGRLLRRVEKAHNLTIRCISFSPDGKMIASSSDDKTISLWDLDGNLISSPFRGHDAPVWTIAFSADSKKIVSGSDDKTLRLWDLQGKQIGLAFEGHTNHIRSVAFNLDGKQIVSGSTDKTLRLWHGDWESWMRVGCDLLRNSSVFQNPQLDIEREACEVCRKYVWDKEKG